MAIPRQPDAMDDAKERARIYKAAVALADPEVSSILRNTPHPASHNADGRTMLGYCMEVMRTGSHAGRLAAARIIERAKRPIK
jgi:hypothetical protein